MKLLLADNLSASFRDYFNALATARPDLEILKLDTGLFRSKEPFADIKSSFKDKDVVLFQSLSGDVSEQCMKMLLTVSALKRKEAKSVTAAIPFAAFGRQDKGDLRACGDFAKLLKAAGVDKVVTADMHSKAAEQDYIDVFGAKNVSFVSSANLFADHIRAAHGSNLDEIVCGAPDGISKPNDAAQARAREITRLVHGLNALSDDDKRKKMFGIEKIHRGTNTTEVIGFTGDVQNKRAMLIDDMSDSGGTLINACEALIQRMTAETSVYISHGLFDEAAIDKILTAQTNGRPTVGKLVLTDSAPGLAEKMNSLVSKHADIISRVEVLTNAPQFAAALAL